ncbi:MAG: hypothetical protein AAB836_02030 [Patescibacteria group bacterium]
MDYKGLTKIGVVILATMGTCNKLPDKEEPKPEIIDTAINDTSADTAEEVKKIIEPQQESKLTLTQQEARFTEDIYKVLEILREGDIYFMGYGMITDDGIPYTVLRSSHQTFGYGLSLPAEKNIDGNFRYNVQMKIFKLDPDSNTEKETLNKIIRTNSIDELVDIIEKDMEPTYFLEMEDL